MATVEDDAPLLLALPDACLLAVLQCCAADDQRSLFSAARAHSRLHQVAVLAQRSITAVVAQQRQMDGVLMYLGRHWQHLYSVSIHYKGVGAHHPWLDLSMYISVMTQLRSLQLSAVLLVAHDSEGLLAPTLTKLRLSSCELYSKGTAVALAAAVSQLSGLEHLSLAGLSTDRNRYVFPAGVLQQLQQLTYLELDDAIVEGPDQDSSVLEVLQALTRLEDLRLKITAADADTIRVTASMLSAAHLLTRLDLAVHVPLEPAVLAGKTRLQHLLMQNCMVGADGDAAALVGLLSQLQQLQQLTHLDLTTTLWVDGYGRTPHAAAYAPLTASSRLQHLNISICRLPAGVWQHIFPAGRQLPQLRELNISDIRQPFGDDGTAPDGSGLVSCCPGLQSLDMRKVTCSAELLAALQGLSQLHTLLLSLHESAWEGFEAMCQLTGLRQLGVGYLGGIERDLWLQMTQLKQLTALTYDDDDGTVSLISQAPSDEPVWRQLLRRYLDYSDPVVAQQAAAALAQ